MDDVVVSDDDVDEVAAEVPATSSKTTEQGRSSSKRYSRKNTRKEKLLMSKLRRKRKKSKKTFKAKIQILKREVTSEIELRKHEIELRKQAEKSLTTYKGISRTYWERWRWELHKRREAMNELRMSQISNKLPSTKTILLHEIDPSMLKDPYEDGQFKETYLARGCFGIVRLQEYRSMRVAVKEFLPRSLVMDVKNEASIITSLSHPYVPFLYGVCTKNIPFRIVMQFHTTCDQEVSTIEKELHAGRDHLGGTTWIILCAQLMEVMHYLHEEVGILHNDIKADNLILARSLKPEDSCLYQIVLIDFGKATKVTESKRYHLSAFERGEYIRRYPHIPPEVIEGDMKPHKGSDIYAAGKLLCRLLDNGCSTSLATSEKNKLKLFVDKCCSIDFTNRPKISECLNFFENLLL